MAAPLNNTNHLKYPLKEAKKLLKKAAKAIKEDSKIFNWPNLHRAIGLKTLRTLPYLAEKYQYNNEFMMLWGLLMLELRKNQQKHFQEYLNNEI